MEYEKIMCKFCKECKQPRINERVIKTTDVRCSDTIVTKCENYCPKYNFEDKSNTTENIALFV